MPSVFGTCFGLFNEPELTAGHLGSRPIDSVNPAKCTFCNVTDDKFNIVLQDADYVCFSDRSPAAAVHLLVIPRVHIANVQSLRSTESDLVRQMQAFGSKAMDLLESKRTSDILTRERRFGFHIPPFRSVDHLHLHCLELPFQSRLKALKYRVAEPSSKEYSKGWSWFAEWRQTCAILEHGGQVKVSPCSASA